MKDMNLPKEVKRGNVVDSNAWEAVVEFLGGVGCTGFLGEIKRPEVLILENSEK